MLLPTKFNTIKQPLGSRCCTAAVAAMATGKTLEYVLNLVPDIRHKDGQRWLHTRHLLSFLGSHGIIFGIILESNGQEMCPIHKIINFEFHLIDAPAIITVTSETFKDCFHYVFWDGKIVRDPNPKKPYTTNLQDYELIEIAPLTYIDEDEEDLWAV